LDYELEISLVDACCKPTFRFVLLLKFIKGNTQVCDGELDKVAGQVLGDMSGFLIAAWQERCRDLVVIDMET
jgi:hypothetical protein